MAGGPGVAAEHARALAAELPGIAVAAGALRGEPAVEAVAARLPRPVRVVPLLMARGWIFALLHRRLAGLEGLEITAPVGTHPGLAAAVRKAAVASAAERGWRPRETLLLVVAHGTLRHPGSAEGALRLAGRLRQEDGWAGVEPAFLDQPPFLAEQLAGLGGRPAVAVGLFVDPGPHGRDDVEAAIAAAGAEVAYTGPLGARPEIRGLLRDRAGLGRAAAPGGRA